MRRYAGPLAAALTVAVLGLAAPADATHDFRLTNPEQQQGGTSLPLAGRTVVIDPGHQLGAARPAGLSLAGQRGDHRGGHPTHPGHDQKRNRTRPFGRSPALRPSDS